jgi:4-hydroxy-tetrahydrodipicolinate synthase
MTRSVTGCGTAIVTPFLEGGAVDEAGLRRLVEFQVGAGIDFLVSCGSTGEAATLSEAEQIRVVEVTVDQVADRCPVMAGAGSNDTAVAVRMTQFMIGAGATHVMHAAPSYNRPPQRGLLAHFTRIADASDVPVMLYNVPGRTACNIEAATTLRLAEHPNIFGIKEASGSIGQIAAILQARPPGFVVLSGDDLLTLPLMALGAEGVVSVISNAAPAQMVALVSAVARGDLEGARRAHRDLQPLMVHAFVDSNPIPIKAALALLGVIGPTVRSPLMALDEAHLPLLRSALDHAGCRPVAAVEVQA